MSSPKSVARISLNSLNDKIIGKKEYADYLYSADAKLVFDTEPYRTETYAIGLLHCGKLEVTRDLITAEIEGPAFICMGPSVIRQWKKINPEYLIEVIFFKKEFLLSISIDVSFIDRFTFFDTNNHYHSSLSEEKLRVIHRLFSLIEFNCNRNYIHKTEMIRALIYQLLFEIEPVYAPVPAEVPLSVLPNESVIKKFKTLLAQKFKETRAVHYYARMLNISAKYLSHLLKEKTGKTANEWIDEMLMLEARVLLHDSNLRIQQIADSLNFPDQSTFGKYFKHHFGSSPLNYRKSLVFTNS
ncbi:MAG: AraC family transcriptional regulator [Ferruginibacter sp.]|nr:AraC family transcriptional regulator [Chitinophagaceae bacterium]